MINQSQKLLLFLISRERRIYPKSCENSWEKYPVSGQSPQEVWLSRNKHIASLPSMSAINITQSCLFNRIFDVINKCRECGAHLVSEVDPNIWHIRLVYYISFMASLVVFISKPVHLGKQCNQS